MRELLGRLDSREFAEWMAFYRMDPWGEERADVRMAQLCAMYANVNKGKRGKQYKIEDFMLFAEKPSDKKPMRGEVASAMVSRLLPRRKI